MFTEAKKVLQRKTQQIFLMTKCKTTEMEAVKGCTVRGKRFALSDCHSYETVSYFSSSNFIALLLRLFPLLFDSYLISSDTYGVLPSFVCSRKSV